jgi:hypothetical protein
MLVIPAEAGIQPFLLMFFRATGGAKAGFRLWPE